MRRFHPLLLVAVTIFVGAVALGQRPAAAHQAQGGTSFVPVGSILEVMLQIVDPTTDAIFDPVSVVVTAEGEKETRPRTDED
jgi:hypothetical protein